MNLDALHCAVKTSRPKSATACSCVCFQVVPCHGVHWPTTACRDVCKFTRVTCISHAHAAVPSPGGRVTRPSLRVSSRNWVSTDGTRDRSARDVCLQRWDYCNSICWRHTETTNAMRETMLWWSRVCTRVPVSRTCIVMYAMQVTHRYARINHPITFWPGHHFQDKIYKRFSQLCRHLMRKCAPKSKKWYWGSIEMYP